MAAALVVLAAALIAWLVTSGGGGAGKNQDDKGGGPAPATSITPGPSGSGPAISQEPGGRDESDGGGSGGSAGASAGSAGSGSGGGSANSGGSGGSTAGTGGGGAAGAAAGGAAAGGGAGRRVQAGTSLPTCAKSAVKVALDSTKVAYAPGEKPQFKLAVTNASGTDCKVDLGAKAMVLTITNTGDDQIWTSKDCPKTAHAYYEVPAHAGMTRTVTWDRRRSTTKCSGPTPPAASAGTYLVQLTTSVATVPQAQSQKSIRLDAD